MNHSGAMLTWKYFYPDKTPLRFLNYIEDYDLSRFNFAETKANLSARLAIAARPDFDLPHIISKLS